MPTLSDVTHTHSQRISAIARRRDERLRDATAARDQQLRELPGAAALYAAFDAQLADARGKQIASDAKAEAIRAGALAQAGDAQTRALAAAQRSRRDADLAAFEKRRQAEDAAEHEFIAAIGSRPSQPTSTDAQKVRAQKLAKAKKEFDDALVKAHQDVRAAGDAAVLEERKASRDAERSFDAAAKVSAASVSAARAAAEQALSRALSALPDGGEVFAEWRQQTAAIVADYRREENEEFARFHLDMQAVTR